MKRLFLLAMVCLMAIPAFSQAKKPSIMFVPSNSWCKEKGYGSMVDVNGTEEFVPNYTAALEDPELLPVLAELNGIMADKGFPALNMQGTMTTIKRRRAEEAAMESKSGNKVMTNDLRELRQQANADIMIYVSWTINRIGPKRSVTFTLDGQDRFTGYSVSTATGTGTPIYSVETAVLLKEAVNAHMELFADRLESYFTDLFDNGRIISLQIGVFENNPQGIDLESEMGDDYKELREVIEDWVYENSQSHRYNLKDDSEIHMNFEVRIAMYDDRGRAQDARGWARGLISYLKKAPYSIEAIKLDVPGLAEVKLVIGEK